MSKLDEEIRKRFTIRRSDDTEEGIYMQRASDFSDGYHQAEKDLELTWKDIRRIYLIVNSTINDVGMDNLSDKSIYQEVLKRFKEMKAK